MLKFETEPITPIGFEDRRMLKTFDKIFSEIFRAALAKWLRAVLSNNVPVQTGMAKAALRPIGRVLKVAIPIKPTRKPYFSALEGGMQSIPFGTQKSTTFHIEDDESHPLRFIYVFEWQTDVLHFWLQKFYTGAHIPGEISIKIAEKAFDEHISIMVERRLPTDIGEYILQR